jgi:hypothetical protein
VPKHDNTSSITGNLLSQNANPHFNTPNTYDTYLSILPERSSESAPDKHLLIHGNKKILPTVRAEQAQYQYTTIFLNAPNSQLNVTNFVTLPYTTSRYNNCSKTKKASPPYDNLRTTLAWATPNEWIVESQHLRTMKTGWTWDLRSWDLQCMMVDVFSFV